MTVYLRFPRAANADAVLTAIDVLLNATLKQQVFAVRRKRTKGSAWTRIDGPQVHHRSLVLEAGGQFTAVPLDAGIDLQDMAVDSAARLDAFIYEIVKRSWTRPPSDSDAGEVKESESSGWHAALHFAAWSAVPTSAALRLERALFDRYTAAADKTRTISDRLKRIAADNGWQNVRETVTFREVDDAEMAYALMRDPEGVEHISWQNAPAQRFA